MYPKIRWDMYYAKFLGTGLRNRGALPRFFSIHEAITKKISVHTFFIKKYCTHLEEIRGFVSRPGLK